MDGTVLIADDDRSIRTVLTQALTRAGCRVHATGSLGQLMRWIDEGRGDLIVTDVMMPDGNGIDLVPAIRKARPDLPVIVISAQNTIVTTIRATEAAVFDYLPKPFDLPDLMARVRAGLERRPRRGGPAEASTDAGGNGGNGGGNGGSGNGGRPSGGRAAEALSPAPFASGPTHGSSETAPSRQAAPSFPAQSPASSGPAPWDSGPARTAGDPAAALVGHAPVMQALFRTLARLVNADLPVIVAGEAGSGRTTVARALHELGDRAAGPLVRIAAGDDESGLRDAVARSRGGTLLIEDAAALDPGAQGRLVAAIETAEGARAPRLVATTGPDPLAEVRAGRLREDLYYRLAGIVVGVPALRSRIDDIPALARHLLDRAAAQGLPRRDLTDPAAEALRAHPFPGNVRELENVLRRILVTGSASPIEAAEVMAALAPAAAASGPAAGGRAGSGAGRSAAAADAGSGMAASGAGEGRLAQSVEAHLQRYFDLHGDALPPPGLHDRILREIERPLIQIALDACGGNQLRCADLLGINRNTLRKKVAELDIQVTRRRRVM